VQRLVRFVGIPAEDAQTAFCVTAPVGVLMPGGDPVQPDFLLIRTANAGIIADRRIRGVPDLIVEVLSPGNPEQDTDIKCGAYARAGVPEYWIIRPHSRDLLVYWQPDFELADFAQVRLISADETLLSPTLAGIGDRVAELFSVAPDMSL
jgi:Uma2 family endonuclease